MFGINQSTVSRIIQRYERWQAHAKDRENGRLDRSERLRAQRWLTYERNELIVASCLRIAHEMEGFTELSKSTICRPIDQPSKQSEVRTEDRVIDRHGVAARFLRLAYRINMKQLKLAALVEPPAAEPLTDEELAEEARQAALDAAEIASARQRAEDLSSRHTPCDEPTDVGCSKSPPGDETHQPNPVPSPQLPARSPMHAVHNLHNETDPQITTTPPAACTCMLQPDLEKNSLCTCIIDCEQPTWPATTQASASEGPGSRVTSPDRRRTAAVA